MNKTQAAIARGLRKRIGADYRLICSRPAGSVSNDEYQAALSDSQQAQSLARYLADNLASIDRLAFCEACGIRSHANQ